MSALPCLDDCICFLCSHSRIAENKRLQAELTLALSIQNDPALELIRGLREERDEALAKYEAVLKQMYSSAIKPCEVHDDFSVGCVPCISTKAAKYDEARQQMEKMREVIDHVLYAENPPRDMTGQEVCKFLRGLMQDALNDKEKN